jgi:hypothetical protein
LPFELLQQIGDSADVAERFGEETAARAERRRPEIAPGQVAQRSAQLADGCDYP